MAENDFERTEPATPRRREEARQEGNVARSPDLTAAIGLLAAILLLQMVGGRMFAHMRRAAEAMLSGMIDGNPTRPDDIVQLGTYTGSALAMILAPIILSILLVGVMATVAQVGMLVTVKPLIPSLGKVSPLRGIKNMFNARAAVRFVMSIGKIMIIALVAGIVIYFDLSRIVHVGELEPAQAFAASGEVVFSLALKLAALLLVLAIIDYTYQRWQRERDLRMSRHDIKEEMKRMDGDPLVRQRRARVARQLAMQRIAQAVPRADVVVTNPTHFAVALKYDNETMRAPKVIAKGADYMAMRIRQIAALHEIPIVERKALAQALYRSVEIGREIPPEHYAAVAEILAYVYRISGKAQTAVA